MIKLAIYFVITVSAVSGVVTFSKIRSHIVSTLISLEFASLSVYMFLFMVVSCYNTEYYITLVYLTMAVCEGALGLSILVSVIKMSGNDFIKSSSLTRC